MGKNNNQVDLIEFSANSADELKKITDFFSQAFGWQYKNYGDNYSDTQDSGVAMGVNATNSGQGSMPLTVLYAENLEATRDKVVQAGGKIVQDIYEFPGGRRFHFTDPAGNELAVWSE